MASKSDLTSECCRFSIFFKNMNIYRKLGKMCDVILKVRETEVSAHYLVLMSSSKYIEDLLSKKQDLSNTIILTDLDGETLINVVEFLYGDEQFYINEDNIEKLYNAAKLLEIDALFKKCTSFCIDKLTTKNCLKIYALSRAYNVIDLNIETTNFINDKISSVIRRDEFLHQDSQTVFAILSSDNLN